MTTRITVSLPDELVAEAKRAVEDGAFPSVSAYVADAMSRHRRKRPHAEVIRELLADSPPLTGEDRAWIEEQWKVLGWQR